jgi:long-chain acyl-CoA synthetase
MLASVVYTSGTTGKPKGVMLTHENILWNAWYASCCVKLETEELFLSFLPLSHTLERTGGYYLPMMIGGEVVYARSINLLAQDLQTVRPTVLISVPRIYERVYARIQDALEKKGAAAQALFNAAVDVGWHRFEYEQGRASWHPKLLAWPVLKRLVADGVTGKLGGRLRYAISGGAALSPDIARVFLGLGVPVLQGYGLTEAGPVVTVNRPESNIPDSIGKPLPGVELKIGENNELLTRSRCVMRGYWDNPEATAAAIDGAGWLHTGDQARVDEHGHMHIVGRIKDIIVLNNGEKVPPEDMESAIALDPLIEQVMIVGEGKPYLAAIATLNPEHWQSWCAEQHLDAAEAGTLADSRVNKMLLAKLAAHLKGFPGYAQVRRAHFTLEPWTVENGILTPTLKKKRAPIAARYAKEIESLF